MTDKILVLNSGSSSLKFSLYQMPDEKELINGYIEKIGFEDSFWTIKINGEKKQTSGYLQDHEAADQLVKETTTTKN